MRDRRGWSLYLGVPGARGGGGGTRPGTTRALRPSPESQRSPSICLRTGSPGSDAAGGEAVRVTCGRCRTPPSALGLLRPFPHAPCPARDSAEQRRRPGASGLEAKRPRHPPQHVSLRPCRSRSVPTVPRGAEMGTGTTLGGLGGASPPFQQPVGLALGVALPQAPPRPRPRQGETF